ncbi:uncharacterized protein TNCV_2483611 [Trichonephila clavipes]|uniref:Uncharacterized protein n=1 Tax=Trichonephila clavipes TaxID=2585209 RepID=A0A8X6VZC3_TRICX|nr:uncharacterized protein TNCV_2483611 [Trichonephila clavipes]
MTHKQIQKNRFRQRIETTRGFLATNHVILNHGQVTWTTPELAPPLLTTTPHQREDVSALDRFNVHRCPTRRLGYWARTRDKASPDLIPIPLGYRGHKSKTKTDALGFRVVGIVLACTLKQCSSDQTMWDKKSQLDHNLIIFRHTRENVPHPWGHISIPLQQYALKLSNWNFCSMSSICSANLSNSTKGAVIICISYTRAFGDGPRNFEPWSSDVDDTRAGNPSPNYHTTPTGGRFSSRQI